MTYNECNLDSHDIKRVPLLLRVLHDDLPHKVLLFERLERLLRLAKLERLANERLYLVQLNQAV